MSLAEVQIKGVKLAFAWSLVAFLFLTMSSLSFAACNIIDEEPIGSKQYKYMRCEYKGYNVVESCDYKLPLVSWTVIGVDTGDQDTSSRDYKFDPEAKKLDCQQTSSKSYESVRKGFDVGHLTAIDLLDYDQATALETNYMVNLVPQVSTFNRTGAWRRSEILTECYREEPGKELTVLSGVLIGNDRSNDFYTESHSLIRTPDRFWKLIFQIDTAENLNAEKARVPLWYTLWIMKNSRESKARTLDSSYVDLDTLLKMMSDDDSELYMPVIELIKGFNVKDSVFRKLPYNSACHRRNG